MTVKKAILILEEFIKYKQFCVEKMNQKKYTTDIEEIRKELAYLHERDGKILVAILSQLQSTKKESKVKSSLSLDMKNAIAEQIKHEISKHKKEKKIINS